ncbi:MFS transporter, partial [Escherichia coli]|nr:MFS transporter [Escherichia coli]
KLKGSKVFAVNVMYVLLGLTFILSGVLPENWFVEFVIVTAIGGISLSVFNGCFTAIVQTEVSPEKLGRVFSLYYSLAVLPSVIGLLFTGLIAEVIGVNSTFIISGCLAIVVGILSFSTRNLMLLGKIKKV